MSDVTSLAQSLASSFFVKASPKEVLGLLQLAKEVREEQQRADQRSEVIDLNRTSLEHAIKLRESVLAGVERTLAKRDEALDVLLQRLEDASTPIEIAQTASAFADIASSNAFKDAAAMVAAIKADKIDLKF